MKTKFFLLSLVVAALSACGGSGGLEGTYSGAHLGKILTFKPNGKAVYGGMNELSYEVSGNEIKLQLPNAQVLVLKKLDDGSIQFPLLGKLTKVPA